MFEGDEKLPWHISVNCYDFEASAFILSINDVAFLQMAHQAEVFHEGPHNIEEGKIELNGTVVSSGFYY